MAVKCLTARDKKNACIKIPLGKNKKLEKAIFQNPNFDMKIAFKVKNPKKDMLQQK